MGDEDWLESTEGDLDPDLTEEAGYGYWEPPRHRVWMVHAHQSASRRTAQTRRGVLPTTIDRLQLNVTHAGKKHRGFSGIELLQRIRDRLLRPAAWIGLDWVLHKA